MPGKWVLGFVLTFWLAGTSPVSAARFDTDIAGTVVAIEGTLVIIKDVQGQLFRAETARIGPDLKGQRHTYHSECLIEVTGQELVKNLQPGMAVQLECRLVNRRALVGDLKKLTLITANAATGFGVISAEPVDDVDAADDEKSDKATLRKREDCTVAGQLVKCKNGNLTIAFAGEKGNIELFVRCSPEDKVEVAGSNLSVVSPGDKIRAKGYTHGLPHFFAREVEIEHVPNVESKGPAAKPEIVKSKKTPQKAAQQPFELGDPEDAAKAAQGNKNAKVKLQVIKVN